MQFFQKLSAITCLIILFSTQSSLFADQGDLVATFDFRAESYAFHPTENLVYATDSTNNRLKVIDIDTMSIIHDMFIGSNPRGIAISSDGGSVYIANSGSTFEGIAAVDTTTYQRTAFQTEYQPLDVAVGHNNTLYISSDSYYDYGMVLNGNDGTNLGGWNGPGGAVQISSDLNRLYFGNFGLSPGTLSSWDVSGGMVPVNIQSTMGLGGNGQDLALSNDGTFLAYMTGGGNGSGYTVFKVPTVDITGVYGEWNLGPYPREAEFSPDDLYAYLVNGFGTVEIFDTNTFLNVGSIDVGGNAFELGADRSGRYLFTSVEDQVRVYDTGFSAVPEPGSGFACLLGSLALFLRRRSRC